MQQVLTIIVSNCGYGIESIPIILYCQFKDDKQIYLRICD